MTIAVAFFCTDGIVIAADSMLTPSLGNLNIGHHTGVKVYVLPGPQIFAFAGDQGQAGRFKVLAEMGAANAGVVQHPILYPISLSQALMQQLQSTGIAANQTNVNTFLGFLHAGACYCSAFEGWMQPRLLDQDHFYAALGTGKLSADPFLRFVTDTFCQRGQPPGVHLATFLAVWVVQHVIDVNPGGVAGPIRVAVFERDPATGNFGARELPPAEIATHVQAIDDAGQALRDWRQAIQTGAAAGNVPPAPAPPPSPQSGNP